MKVYAVGAYGYGNFGDDFYVEVMRRRMPDVDWTFHQDPSEYRPFAFDFTVMAGGGLLYNRYSDCGSSSLRHHFRYPAVAQWFEKKTAMLGTGVQGHPAPEALEPYVPILQSMQVRTVRDRRSAEFLRSLGVPSVLECADLAYVWPAAGRVRARRAGSRPVLGIVASQPGSVLAHRPYEGFEARIERALEALRADFEVRFFSFDSRHDRWLGAAGRAASPTSAYERSDPKSLQGLIEAFDGVDLFVTTRYHGVVLSLLRQTPFVAIGAPGEKTARECESVDYPYFVSYDAGVDILTEAVRSAWAEREALGERCDVALAEKRRSADRNFALLRAAQLEPDDLADRVALGVRPPGAGRRTLVVWAAKDRFWPEASVLFDRLGRFDALLPGSSAVAHARIEARLRPPPPGLMHWEAFDPDLRRRLEGRYDDVIVCHGSEGPLRPESLLGIAAASGSSAWEFRLWRHTLRRIEDDELDRCRPGRLPDAVVRAEDALSLTTHPESRT